jgi:hypothetical protein
LGARGRQFKSAHPDFVKVAVAALLALAVLVVVSAATSSTVDFRGTVAPIPAVLAKRMTGVSWKPGCPVALRDLRLLTLSHWDFEGRVRTGRLVVHEEVARDLVGVFRVLYAARFPIRRMWLIDAYGGSDFRSIEQLLFALQSETREPKRKAWDSTPTSGLAELGSGRATSRPRSSGG